ncbi:hypothetical protein [Polaromonas eurypsychrophila]|uniref:Uncharacterized protein n=1 Tax=Polaromonas eurypsychrophila TaxID=1614635 RepID=A0A916WKQ9_9BURK|nr:hypothetical protein [Polaromonas eurypsychrophila]GGB07003.1 hypothetical protein GCM10011496_29850 [Polaromonas eurypsychrophila]
MTTAKKQAPNLIKPKTAKPYVLTVADKATMAVKPSMNGAAVIQAYQGNVMGKDADINVLIDRLRDTFTEVKGGDLHTLEAMLISQATALQTIFTSLARRAQDQQYQKNLEAFLGLALKAQAQSRATISALVDLKYPRQATFVKQANIANGPQQVNNGGAVGGNPDHYAQARTHAENSAPEQNKLLEVRHGQPGKRMDTRAAQAAERSYQAVETVAAVYRAKKPRG